MEERLYHRCPAFLQSAAVSFRGWQLLRKRFGPEFDRLSAFLERSERLSREELRAYQDERLRAVVAHAYETVPYYTRLFDELGLRPDDVSTVDDLPKLPVLTKELIVENMPDMTSRAFTRRSMTQAWTSGTTGHMIMFYWDTEIDIMTSACLWRGRRWAGFEFGMPYATLMGTMIAAPQQKRPPFWRRNRSWNQIFMSAHHLTDENLPLYLDAMRKERIEALEAYPSTAVVLARFLEREGDHLPLRCVFTTAEPLLEPDRAVIEERFRCVVFDAYSQAERVVYTAQCGQNPGQHVFEEYGVCEIVDGDGNPVAAGEPGRLVGTGLHNFAMPLLRYDVGDVAAKSTETCSCGRTLELLGLVATRQGDIISTPDGRMLPPLMALRPFKYVNGIRASQVIQHTLTDFTARVATERPLEPEVIDELIHNLKLRLGESANVRIEQMNEIPRSANRKFRRVVSEVPLAWDGTVTSEELTRDEPDDGRSEGAASTGAPGAG